MELQQKKRIEEFLINNGWQRKSFGFTHQKLKSHGLKVDSSIFTMKEAIIYEAAYRKGKSNGKNNFIFYTN